MESTSSRQQNYNRSVKEGFGAAHYCHSEQGRNSHPKPRWPREMREPQRRKAVVQAPFLWWSSKPASVSVQETAHSRRWHLFPISPCRWEIPNSSDVFRVYILNWDVAIRLQRGFLLLSGVHVSNFKAFRCVSFCVAGSCLAELGAFTLQDRLLLRCCHDTFLEPFVCQWLITSYETKTYFCLPRRVWNVSSEPVYMLETPHGSADVELPFYSNINQTTYNYRPICFDEEALIQIKCWWYKTENKYKTVLIECFF